MTMMSARGFGRGTQGTDPSIISGNATTNMSTTGFTQLTAVAGVDDGFAYIPTDASFNFFFFGTDYGKNNVVNGIYWNTNNVVGFGTGVNTITWVANTGRGVLIGNADRRTNQFWYSPMTTSGTSKITQFLLFFQNIYNDGVTNAGQYRIRLIRSSTKQYIEVRIFKGSGGANSGTISTTGQWNITNGTTFQGTYGSTFNSTFPADNTSFVLSSDINGNNWTFTNTAYVNI
jgi:hypothetical protein